MEKYLTTGQVKKNPTENSDVFEANSAGYPEYPDEWRTDEIKEIRDRRVCRNTTEYYIVPNGLDEGLWVKEAYIVGDIHSLVDATSKKQIAKDPWGEEDILTSSKETMNGAKADKAKKRKRSLNTPLSVDGVIPIENSKKYMTFSNWKHNLGGTKGGLSVEHAKQACELQKLNVAAKRPVIKTGKKFDLVLQGNAERRIRKYFLHQLQKLFPVVTLFNDIDNSSPPLDFVFIKDYILREGVKKMDNDSMAGCECQTNGGCEPLSCRCVEQMNEKNRMISYIPSAHGEEAILRDDHMSTRDAIFECNSHCSCDDDCLNKLVQWGRTVPLEIFKTVNRGWGLRCLIDLQKGQFIDAYKGEVITNAEATRREVAKAKKGGKAKDSYLYTMEKFAEDNGIPRDELFVVDGEFYGCPSRFINHSCDPNLRQFSVSYHHGDAKVYDLAFFAVEDIPAGTELTFNYTDDDHGSRRKGKRGDCLCGSEKCRGYIWP